MDGAEGHTTVCAAGAVLATDSFPDAVDGPAEERVRAGPPQVRQGDRLRKRVTNRQCAIRTGFAEGGGRPRRRGSTAGIRIPKRSAVVAIVAG